MPSRKPRETELYAPLKTFLEARGYEVKGEVRAADMVAMRDGAAPLIIELKTGFALTLFHQAVARQAITDDVYIAVPRGRGRAFQSALKANLGLCRRLGLGLITVRLSDGLVEAHLDPAPFRPRKSARARDHLLREFARRRGDPTPGGSAGATVMTAYRQDALRCLDHLCRSGPTPARGVASATGVANARTIMADNHYGWFERVARGIYGPTELGIAERAAHSEVLAHLGG